MHNFKLACKTTVVFLLVLAIVSAGFMEVYFQGNNHYYLDAAEREEVSGTIDYMISGASHGLRAFIPGIIDEQLGVCSYNLSGSRMTMKGRYTLLEKELKRNPVKRVILELSYDSLTRDRKEEGPEGDIYVLGRLKGMERAKFFFGAIYPKEYPSVYYDTMNRGIGSSIKLLLKKYHARLNLGMKGYCPFAPSEIDHDVPRDYTDYYHQYYFSEEPYKDNEIYLNKILDLCEERGVEVTIVTAPMADSTNCYYANLETFYEWYVQIARERNVAYYDFNLLKEKDELLPEETAFFDGLHLNNNGGIIFTNRFCEIMKTVSAGEDVSDLFFSSYEELDASRNYENWQK